MAISTIFLSFLEDCEVNDGTAEKPYANRSTQKYFGKKIAKMKAQKENMNDSTDELHEMR